MLNPGLASKNMSSPQCSVHLEHSAQPLIQPGYGSLGSEKGDDVFGR